MARKKTGLSQTLFQGIDPYGEGEAQEGDLQTLPLAAIRPDPDQPRRLLPADLARAVADGDLTPLAAMRAWVEQAKKGAEDAGLAALRRLADSISRHGLINPISVRRLQEGEEAPEGVAYFIVTGERRYWAHVLLALEGRNLHAGETVREPTEIRAGLTAPGITVRAHQLIENIMREDINAVEKARGLWALRYELSQVNSRSPVNYSSPEDSPPPDLVPWKRVSEELGISKRYRIYLTSVLKLSEEAQALVTEHDLAEVTIRPIVQKLRDDPALQVAALQQLVTWQEENEAEDGPNRAITRSVSALVDELLQRKEKASDRDVQDAARAVDHAAQTRLFRRRVRHVLRFLYDLPDEDRTLLARDLALDAQFSGVGDELRDLQRQIDALLQRVETYRRDAE